MTNKTPMPVSSSVGHLVRALEVIANGENWFHTTDEAGGPYTAWRGSGEPDQLAEKALQDAGFHYTPHTKPSGGLPSAPVQTLVKFDESREMKQ